MTAWWAGLAPRERITLAGGGGVWPLVVTYLATWQPLARQPAAVGAEIGALSADLAWMQQVAGQVKRRGAQQSSQPAAASGGSVLTLVEVSARSAGLHQALERVQPEGQGARLWLTETGFDKLVAWLGDLEQRHGLQVSQLAVDAGNAPGTVTARIK